MPIPRARRRGADQFAFDEWTEDRIDENREINRTRSCVALWRPRGRPRITVGEPPAKGKIVIKVINHYDNEVLKVYDVESL
ncbi:MAG TPA: hypothetical protein VF297_18335 [Pyrinomonadaceae bacterium]